MAPTLLLGRADIAELLIQHGGGSPGRRRAVAAHKKVVRLGRGETIDLGH
jgi:hypothetical protein